LTSGLNTSTGVAVDSSGTVYVSNKYTATVQVFPKGKRVPTATMATNLTGPDGLAVDRNDNLFIADGSRDDVLKVTHGSLLPQPLHLQGVDRPVGVAVDTQGNLFVSNLAGGASNVTAYAPGSRTPTRTFVLPYSPNTPGAIGEPVMLSMGPADMLIASAFISLSPIDGELFGGPGVIVGFASGQSHPEWSGYGISASDTVFQPAR
jgi:serine/threonine-protein kinase